MCAALVLAVLSKNIWLIAGALLFVGISIFYTLHAFKILLDGAKRMSQGDLDTQVDTDQLMGGFTEFATHLNALADVAVVAAQKQMRSERMRAELITNVTHDIKTPLTSIINYVDLLQKPHTENQGEEYLDVLARQSQRMKKLVDDLMDMSKAATGNMTVEMTEMDAVEAVNQALGEFSDKLAAVPLYPVIRCPEEKLMIRGDGRLVWRTLSNLLQNAVKYALPGTRLYVDMACVEGNVVISLKNVSREELNISADELMERFVRGDASRNTEGSGLGLNIARSLMELQKGQLRILVDGDLFKTSLIFPAGDSQ
jgi:signal transduction histidine kinase